MAEFNLTTSIKHIFGVLSARADWFKGTYLSLLLLIFSGLCIESFFFDHIGFDLLPKISIGYNFFVSSSGQAVLAPMTVVLGGVVGYFTAEGGEFQHHFWSNFYMFTASVALLLVLVVFLGLPDNSWTAKFRELNSLNPETDGLYAFFSAICVAVTTWVSNRLTNLIKHNTNVVEPPTEAKEEQVMDGGETIDVMVSKKTPGDTE